LDGPLPVPTLDPFDEIPDAHFIVSLGAMLLSAVLITVGMNRLSGVALKPKVTFDQIEPDKAAAKEMVR
jgi:hypothetical protein